MLKVGPQDQVFSDGDEVLVEHAFYTGKFIPVKAAFDSPGWRGSDQAFDRRVTSHFEHEFWPMIDASFLKFPGTKFSFVEKMNLKAMNC